MLFKRADADLVSDVSFLRRVMPLLMPGRNESIVFFEQTIDVTHTLEFLELRKDVSFFHIVLASIARAIYQRPHMNRFVSGGKLYQRKNIVLSFAVKKKLTDEAGMTAVKTSFTGKESLLQVVEKVEGLIHQGRSHSLTHSEKEMQLALYLPNWLLKGLLFLQKYLDGFNLLPEALTRQDPCYTSMFLANLGSVGLDAPYHHLYEYGNATLFGCIGKIHWAPLVDEQKNIVPKQVVTLRYSFDERATDGLYCAKSLELFAHSLKNPELLMHPLP